MPKSTASEVDQRLYLAGITEGFTFTVTDVICQQGRQDSNYQEHWETAFKCVSGERVEDFGCERWEGANRLRNAFEVSPTHKDGSIGISVLSTPEQWKVPRTAKRNSVDILFKITGSYRTTEGKGVELGSDGIDGRITISTVFATVINPGIDTPPNTIASAITYNLSGSGSTVITGDIYDGNTPAEGVYAPDLHFVVGVTELPDRLRVSMNSAHKGWIGDDNLKSMIECKDGSFDNAERSSSYWNSFGKVDNDIKYPETSGHGHQY